MEFFEAFMLVCFGVSWPVSVLKSWRSRSTGGKSLLFLCLIELGYAVGIIGKIVYNPSWVIVVYAINICFVTADLALYCRNRRIEGKESAARA